MHLYANRWILVNKIRIFAGGDILRETQLSQFYRYANISQHFYRLKIFDKLEIQQAFKWLEKLLYIAATKGLDSSRAKLHTPAHSSTVSQPILLIQ